ncbi:hypothetical protein CANARDRAFT_203298 [[Candida] arabinofermentans NRRL YB-2248]|uniref:Major facilitator superfamily (MFS) profile domain-containing protein n=1 Tax=[Candida] arabinofermentans NRRL YB-2248 TaxID=983967 RepID=A0A1E4SV81_9ASCO|nr:hypothetical protein CANARDRAFT_203298 [[Candida] arabinofermentans NRRL YB-2248]
MKDKKDIHSDDESISSSLSERSSIRYLPDHTIEPSVSGTNNLQSIKACRTKSLISRTSSLIDAIRDDNQITVQHDKDIIEPAPFYTDDEKLQRKESKKLSCQETNLEKVPEEIELERSSTDKTAIDEDDGEFAAQDILDRPPDGTFWGWTAAICVCSANCFSWGGNSAFGVFLSYYLNSNYFPGATMEDFALIGGLALGVSFMLCNFSVVLVKRYNLKVIMSIGAVIQFICYWLASIATTINQLIIFQGFLMAIGYTMIAGPSFIIIPSWFLKRRSVASGIGVSGAGIAGVVFSRSSQKIMDVTGSHKWALRMIALVSGFMLFITIILIKPRKPFNSKDTSLIKEFKKTYNFKIFFQKPILYVTAWNFIYAFSYTIILFSLSSFGTSIGLTSKQGSIVVTVQSVAQAVGRPALGYISDKCGRANSSIFFTFFIGLITIVFWVFITTYGQLIAFGFISGIFLGVNWVNFTPLAADVVGGGEDLSSAVAFMTFICGIPYVVSELIGLKLVRSNMDKPYLYCQILVALSCAVSGAFLLPFREWKIKRMLTARRKNIVNHLEAGEELSEKDEKRLKRYDTLLKENPMGYIMRMLYPIKA